MDTNESTLGALFEDDRHHRVPPKAGMMGMVLFLASLFMLFAGGMMAYVLIRTTGTNQPPPGTVHVPSILFLSTFILIASSVTIHLALNALRREKQVRFRQMLVATLVLSVGFLLVQTPGLVGLYKHYEPKREVYTQQMDQAKLEAAGLGRGVINHEVQAAYPQEMHVLALIVTHGLHVVGGLIPLFVITLNAHQGRYDHEHVQPVRLTALYWHFLDVVWIVMFALIWMTA